MAPKSFPSGLIGGVERHLELGGRPNTPSALRAMIVYDQTRRCAQAGNPPTTLQKIYPTPSRLGSYSSPMNPPTTFSMLIATGRNLLAAVTTRDNLHIRPLTASKAVATRLASGMRLLRAFLRRLIILIALDMEWGLVDTRGAMKRPHRCKAKSSAGFALGGLDVNKASPWLNSDGPQFKTNNAQVPSTPVPINMAKLYAQLDFLAGIAANPHARAKRLAFHLGRTYQGIMMAPQGPKRIAGRWGTQVSASFDAMAAAIMTGSRNRPPPLPPPRTHWPTITAV